MHDYQSYEIAQFRAIIDKMRPAFYFKANCLDANLSWFFPNQGQSGLMQKAIEICNRCEVKEECFDYAMKGQIEHGVWGGTSAEQRRRWFADNVSADEAWLEQTS
jgi:WhiB family redox-sensing transcriptional regulator